MGPDVTIIVATYDRPDWLAVSLSSIQTSAAVARLREIETRVLVVDDASPGEATAAAARAYGADYIRNPVNDGRNDPAVCRVLGLQATDSPYYAFFDDDDVMLPRWIRLHVEALEGGADVCSTAYVWTDADLMPTRTVVPDRATLGDLLVGRIPINDHSLVRTERARQAVWETELENVMQFQIWLELAFQGCRFERLTEPTFLHRRHAGNISDQAKQDPRDAELRQLVIERYRRKVLERDGVLPAPTVKAEPVVTPARPPARRPLWRRVAGRLRRLVT